MQGIIGHTNAASVNSILQGKLTQAKPSLPTATQIPIGMSSVAFQTFSARTVTQIEESGSTCLEGATTMLPESQYVPTEVGSDPIEVEIEVADDDCDERCKETYEQSEEAREECEETQSEERHEEWSETHEQSEAEWDPEASHEQFEETHVEETHAPLKKKRRT